MYIYIFAILLKVQILVHWDGEGIIEEFPRINSVVDGAEPLGRAKPWFYRDKRTITLSRNHHQHCDQTVCSGGDGGNDGDAGDAGDDADAGDG